MLCQGFEDEAKWDLFGRDYSLCISKQQLKRLELLNDDCLPTWLFSLVKASVFWLISPLHSPNYLLERFDSPGIHLPRTTETDMRKKWKAIFPNHRKFFDGLFAEIMRFIWFRRRVWLRLQLEEQQCHVNQRFSRQRWAALLEVRDAVKFYSNMGRHNFIRWKVEKSMNKYEASWAWIKVCRSDFHMIDGQITRERSRPLNNFPDCIITNL